MENINMGKRLKDLRNSKNLTQKQVSERLGIAVSTLSGYELEEKHPSYFVLMKLARLYDVTTDYLIGMAEKRSIDVTGLSEREINAVAEMVTLLKGK